LTVVVVDEFELVVVMVAVVVVLDELVLLDVIGHIVVVVVGTSDEVLLEVVGCTVVVVVGIPVVVLLDVVGCTVVVVVGTSDEVLLDVVGSTVVVDELVLLDELELLTGCVVVVDDGTEYAISIYATKSSGSVVSREAMFWYSLVGPSCCILMSMPLSRSLARLPFASVLTSMAASQSLPAGTEPEENTLLS
jgi:hypothetical protein